MKNLVWYIIGFIIIIVSIKQCESYNSKRFEKKVNTLQKKVDSLKKVNDSINFIILALDKKIFNQEMLSDSLRDRIESTKKRKDEILIDVRDYDEYKLDSILSNHRHIQRTEN